MAEVLGGIASVLTVIESVAHVAKDILSCRNASNESRRLVKELSHVRGVLTTLKETIDENRSESWSSVLLLLNNQDGPILQLQELVKQLDCRVTGPSQESGLRKAKIVLQWPFREAETLKLIDAVERLKGIFELALECSHIRLSKAIASNVEDIGKDIEHIKQELRSSSQKLDSVDQITQAIQMDVENSIHELQGLQTSTKSVGEALQKNTETVESLDDISKRRSSQPTYPCRPQRHETATSSTTYDADHCRS